MTAAKATPRSAANADHEPWRRVLLAAVPALAFLLCCSPLADPDVWWHLKTGELILAARSVPHIDLFTYTSPGRPWIDVYWLYQIGLALLYRVGGASILVLCKAAAGAAIVALSILARRPNRLVWPFALAWLPSLLLVSGRLSERPEMVSLVLLSAFLTVLARAPEAPRTLWLLPVLELLWVNCHGFFVMGPLVVIACGMEWVVDRGQPRPPMKLFVAVAVSTVLASLVNPYGPKAVRLPLEQLHKIEPGIYRATIGEFKTIGDFIAGGSIWNPYLLAYFAAVLLGIGSFVICARRARFHPSRALLFAAFGYLAWRATRNTGLFGIVAAFVTIWNLDDAVAATGASTRQAIGSNVRERAGLAFGVRRRALANAALLAAWVLVAYATLSGGLYAWAGEGRQVGLGERPRWFAHDACAFLGRPGMPERLLVYNLNQAAVCIAHSAPAHKQFMDPRLEVNPQETYERYLAGLQRLWLGDRSWETVLGIDHTRPDEVPAILIERGPADRAGENLSRDPRWRCVFADDLAAVFVTSRFAEQHGLRPVPIHALFPGGSYK